MTTATWSVAVALVQAVEADGPIRGLLAGDAIYSGAAPQGSAMPYIVIGPSTEANAHLFGRRGKRGTETLHVWTEDTSKKTCQDIYGHLERILNGTRLVLSGHSMVEGTLEYVTDQLDPDGRARQLVARYRVRTLEGS